MDYDVNAVRAGLEACARAALSNKPLLTELDSRSGDGDLGISMDAAARAILDELSAYRGADIGGLLMKCAMTCNRAAPSTMGTLLSSALLMVGKRFRGRTALGGADVVQIPIIMADAIMVRGNAKLGDKTVLDALIPLGEAFARSYEGGGDLGEAAREAAAASWRAAKATKGLIAKVGRAKWIADRSRVYPDTGAVLCALMMDALAFPGRPKGYRLPDYESLQRRMSASGG